MNLKTVSWIKKPEIRKRRSYYQDQVRCYICRKNIKMDEKFYDGGHGCRAHVECVDKLSREENHAE